MHFKIDWASLILGRKFTVFLCFTLYLRAVFNYNPSRGVGGGGREGLYLEGRFNGGFNALQVWGACIGEAYTWRGLFLEFYGMTAKKIDTV